MERKRRRTLATRLAEGVHRYLETQLSANPPIASSMAYLVPLNPFDTRPPGPRPALDEVSGDPLPAWVRSGGLTWGEAESLLALDRRTTWDEA